jgi:hypothetical protein
MFLSFFDKFGLIKEVELLVCQIHFKLINRTTLQLINLRFFNFPLKHLLMSVRSVLIESNLLILKFPVLIHWGSIRINDILIFQVLPRDHIPQMISNSILKGFLLLYIIQLNQDLLRIIEMFLFIKPFVLHVIELMIVTCFFVLVFF